jgi:streptomycin 3"-adenylyltransferase
VVGAAGALGLLDGRSREQIGIVVELVRDVLAADALGAYLHGSAVLGKLRAHSDLDVLVVAARPTTDGEKRSLISGLLPVSGSTAGREARSIELTIVVERDVRPWRYPPRFDFQYGDWLRAEFERGEVAPWPSSNPDLAVVLTVVREHGLPLFGPGPGALLDAVPPADVRHAVLDSLDELRADLDWDTRNVILTLARMWITIETGEIHSKDAAASWAIARLPVEDRRVLDLARAVYLGEAVERWDDLGGLVAPCADRMVAAIRAGDGRS